jgi:sugar phosphate isomerase/epimerase
MNMAVAHTYKREDEEVNAQRLAEVEGVAKLMKRLGVEVASFYPGYRCDDRPWEDVLEDSATTIREMLAIGERHDVTFVVETHFATIYETLEQGVRLLETVPELMVAFDPSHYVMQSIDLRDCTELLDRAAHMHMRDAAPEKMCVPVGEGTVDFEWLIDAMGHRDYRGHWSIEYLPGKTPDVETDITKLRDILQPAVG